MVNALSLAGWYKRPDVQYEIVKFLKDRELAFLSKDMNVRALKAHAVKFLDSHMRAFKFASNGCNMYYSLARYNHIPTMSYNLSKRIEQQQEFNKEVDQGMHITCVDLGFDLDTEIRTTNADGELEVHQYPHDRVKSDAIRLCGLLSEYGVGFTVRASPNGFHVIVPADNLPDEARLDMTLQKRFAESVADILKLDTLDTSIYQVRRVFKVPYSYDVKSDLICTPLTMDQLRRFSWERVRMDSLKRLGVRDRGDPELSYTEPRRMRDMMIDVGVL